MTGLGAAVGVGDSWLHRARAGVKLGGLVAFSAICVAFRSVPVVCAAAVVVAVLYAVSGVGWIGLRRQVRPVLWFVVFLVPFHALASGWLEMVAFVGLLVVTVAAAGLVTETTRVSDMLDALTTAMRPLRVIGVDPQRVALVLSMTIRGIPVVHGIVAETRDARRARGLDRSTKALVTPVVIRTIRHAERTGEAMAARGFDD